MALNAAHRILAMTATHVARLIGLASILLGAGGCSRATRPLRPASTTAAVHLAAAGRPAGSPRSNRQSDDSEKIDLGRRSVLRRSSVGQPTFSCASCHQQAHAFTDGRAQAIGSTGALHARSAMSLANVAYNATLGWADASLLSLEAQMAVPMFNEHPIELGIRGREQEVVARFTWGGRPRSARRSRRIRIRSRSRTSSGPSRRSSGR